MTLEAIKDLITVKTVSAAIAGTASILGSLWAIDSHYASAADVAQVQRSVTVQMQIMRQVQIDDKLFELDVKRETLGKLTPVEEAMYRRYERQREANTSIITRAAKDDPALLMEEGVARSVNQASRLRSTTE